MSLDYLIIEQFLTDALKARALQAAFDLSMIDALANAHSIAEPQLSAGKQCDVQGGRFLLQMLASNNVVSMEHGKVSLTDDFRKALPFRDLLTTKLKFSTVLAADYFSNLPNLLQSEETFMQSSKLFELFDYGRCLEVTTANCMHASQWMQLTTMLTRYEAAVCHHHYDFQRHSKMLDVGGNSGEFCLQVCKRSSDLTAQILDLPVVCQVGERHVSRSNEASRITFCPGNMLQDPFPSGCDLLTWKSVLHDWPDQHLPELLQKSFDALEPGGTLLIFERQRWDFSQEAISYGLLPVMLFFRSYRMPEHYQQALTESGFTNVKLQQVQLEVPFLLITATKAG